MTFAPLSSATRKFLVAAAIVTGLGFAAPVQAEDNVQFGFSIGNGNSGFSFSLGNGGYIGRHFNPPPVQRACMNTDQVRNQLRAQGYRWITFEGDYQGWVHVQARQNNQRYEFDVNRCNGAVANMVAIGRPNGGFPGGGFPGGGFPGGGFPGGGFPGGGFGFGGGPGFHR